jgi:hypothetical protein
VKTLASSSRKVTRLIKKEKEKKKGNEVSLQMCTFTYNDDRAHDDNTKHSARIIQLSITGTLSFEYVLSFFQLQVSTGRQRS